MRNSKEILIRVSFIATILFAASALLILVFGYNAMNDNTHLNIVQTLFTCCFIAYAIYAAIAIHEIATSNHIRTIPKAAWIIGILLVGPIFGVLYAVNRDAVQELGTRS